MNNTIAQGLDHAIPKSVSFSESGACTVDFLSTDTRGSDWYHTQTNTCVAMHRSVNGMEQLPWGRLWYPLSLRAAQESTRLFRGYLLETLYG